MSSAVGSPPGGSQQHLSSVGGASSPPASAVPPPGRNEDPDDATSSQRVFPPPCFVRALPAAFFNFEFFSPSKFLKQATPTTPVAIAWREKFRPTSLENLLFWAAPLRGNKLRNASSIAVVSGPRFSWIFAVLDGRAPTNTATFLEPKAAPFKPAKADAAVFFDNLAATKGSMYRAILPTAAGPRHDLNEIDVEKEAAERDEADFVCFPLAALNSPALWSEFSVPRTVSTGTVCRELAVWQRPRRKDVGIYVSRWGTVRVMKIGTGTAPDIAFEGAKKFLTEKLGARPHLRNSAVLPPRPPAAPRPPHTDAALGTAPPHARDTLCKLTVSSETVLTPALRARVVEALGLQSCEWQAAGLYELVFRAPRARAQELDGAALGRCIFVTAEVAPSATSLPPPPVSFASFSSAPVAPVPALFAVSPAAPVVLSPVATAAAAAAAEDAEVRVGEGEEEEGDDDDQQAPQGDVSPKARLE